MTIRNYTPLPVDDLIGYILQAHCPQYQGTIIICHNDLALRHYSTPELELEALTYGHEIEGNHFSMLIRRGLRYPDRVICHEMVHLMQLLRGDLSLNLPARTFTWKGITYHASMKYEDRPWEREAFRMEGKLLKEYKSSKTRRT